MRITLCICACLGLSAAGHSASIAASPAFDLDSFGGQNKAVRPPTAPPDLRSTDCNAGISYDANVFDLHSPDLTIPTAAASRDLREWLAERLFSDLLADGLGGDPKVLGNVLKGGSIPAHSEQLSVTGGVRSRPMKSAFVQQTQPFLRTSDGLPVTRFWPHGGLAQRLSEFGAGGFSRHLLFGVLGLHRQFSRRFSDDAKGGTPADDMLGIDTPSRGNGLPALLPDSLHQVSADNKCAAPGGLGARPHDARPVAPVPHDYPAANLTDCFLTDRNWRRAIRPKTQPSRNFVGASGHVIHGNAIPVNVQGAPI